MSLIEKTFIKYDKYLGYDTNRVINNLEEVKAKLTDIILSDRKIPDSIHTIYNKLIVIKQISTWLDQLPSGIDTNEDYKLALKHGKTLLFYHENKDNTNLIDTLIEHIRQILSNSDESSL